MRLLYYNAKARRPYKSEKVFANALVYLDADIEDEGAVSNAGNFFYRKRLVLQHFFLWYYNLADYRRFRVFLKNVFRRYWGRLGFFEYLMSHLERLLPVVLVRLNWVRDWSAALFYIRSGLVFVNGMSCRVTSYLTRPGDILEMAPWFSVLVKLRCELPLWWKQLAEVRAYVLPLYSVCAIFAQTPTFFVVRESQSLSNTFFYDLLFPAVPPTLAASDYHVVTQRLPAGVSLSYYLLGLPFGSDAFYENF